MKKYLITLLVLGSLLSCEKFPLPSPCGESIIVDGELFENAPRDEFILNSASITGDCLNLNISYGGGCGSIETKLLTNDVITLSNPPQMQVRLSLKDEDLCEALVTKDLSFDLKAIRTFGAGKIIINLNGWDQELIYNY